MPGVQWYRWSSGTGGQSAMPVVQRYRIFPIPVVKVRCRGSSGTGGDNCRRSKFTWFGDIGFPKPHRCTRFGFIDGPRPHELVGFGASGVAAPFVYIRCSFCFLPRTFSGSAPSWCHTWPGRRHVSCRLGHSGSVWRFGASDGPKPYTLGCAIVLPGRRSGFRAGFRPDFIREASKSALRPIAGRPESRV